MYTNVNLAAPAGAFAFLGTTFIVLVLGVTIIYSLIKKKLAIRRFAFMAIAIIGGLYLSLMLLFSLKSSDRMVPRGQEKHFCEIDCHLAYSIVDVRETKSLGDLQKPILAAGMFRVITIRTRFDENTISRTRGNGPLKPNSRVVALVDGSGRQYFPSQEGQRFLEQSGASGTPFTASLRPAETYTTTLVFDLPADATNATLLIREGGWLTHFLIGHENSPLHKKTWFQI